MIADLTRTKVQDLDEIAFADWLIKFSIHWLYKIVKLILQTDWQQFADMMYDEFRATYSSFLVKSTCDKPTLRNTNLFGCKQEQRQQISTWVSNCVKQKPQRTSKQLSTHVKHKMGGKELLIPQIRWQKERN